MDSFNEDDFPEVSYFKNRAANILKGSEQMIEKLWDSDKMETEETKIDTAADDEAFLAKISERLKQNKPPSKKKGKEKPQIPKKRIQKKDEKKKRPSRGCRRSSRRCKTDQVNYADDDEPEEIADSPVINLPSASKRKLTMLQRKNDRERKIIEEETKGLFTSSVSDDEDSLEMLESVSDHRLNLKIRYMADIYRIDVSETEKFSSIFQKIGEKLKLNPTEIMLCREDENIRGEDTPQSLDIKIFEIIECIPFKPSTEKSEDENNIVLKLQSSEKNKVEMLTNKFEKFSVLMKKYSTQQNIPLKNLIFTFDGEKISGHETPEELDMESGNCVDVTILGLEKVSKPTVVDLEAEDFVSNHKMLDICVLD